MSVRQRATTGYRGTRVWPFSSKKERKVSRICDIVYGREVSGLPMKVYSTQGWSPHTLAPASKVQNQEWQEEHWSRWNPLERKYSNWSCFSRSESIGVTGAGRIR